jgi:phage tail sheath protein FI
MSVPYEYPSIIIGETLAPLNANINGVPGLAVGCFAGAFNQGPTVPTLIQSWSQFTQLYGTLSTANGNLLPYAVNQFFNNGGSQCYVLRVPNSDAVTASLTLQDVNSPPDNVMTITAVSPGAWANSVYIAITSAGNSGRFNFVVYSGGNSGTNVVENFLDLSINPADPRNVVAVINSPISGSNYVNINVTLPGTYSAGVNDPALISATLLSGGSDGITAPNLSTAVPASLDTLQGIILNLNLPGVYQSTTLNPVIAWAEGRGDVMLVIDGPPPAFPETSADVAQNYINIVSGGSAITASTYAALYAPWVLVNNPASSIANAAIWLPPGGSVLGVWNKTDINVGPSQTPAGVTYGQVSLQNLEAQFTPTDLANLENYNINPIRFVPGYYPCIMGGRTLDHGYPDQYLSVRRELIQLENDFTQLLQFALFSPNDTTLWNQIVYVLTNYLNQQLQQGVFGGTTQADSFSVTCDTSNNTPATAAAGIVNISVAVSLLSPAEFIFINISQFQNTGTTVTTTSTSS